MEFPAVFGHRGLVLEGAPTGRRENTLEAFRTAVEAGLDGVELDVRRSADGVLVVHHGPGVEGVGPISATPAGALPEWLPTLADALAACEPLLVNVEVKDLPGEPGWDPAEPTARAVAELLAEAGLGARTLVSSFSLAALDAVRETSPDQATGWLTAARYDQFRALKTAAERGHRALHPQQASVTEGLVTEAHRAGLLVVAWTVNDQRRMAELAGMGLDVLITDEGRRALEARRQSA
ncbi:MAG TPA: glycerophosphodiester phosphodiesterase [Acidimicrobiales bacterium]|nr:glycerophosphodiester phosphodiesterase [Acidimicrobiales bacterium]